MGSVPEELVKATTATGPTDRAVGLTSFSPRADLLKSIFRSAFSGDGITDDQIAQLEAWEGVKVLSYRVLWGSSSMQSLRGMPKQSVTRRLLIATRKDQTDPYVRRDQGFPLHGATTRFERSLTIWFGSVFPDMSPGWELEDEAEQPGEDQTLNDQPLEETEHNPTTPDRTLGPEAPNEDEILDTPSAADGPERFDIATPEGADWFDEPVPPRPESSVTYPSGMNPIPLPGARDRRPRYLRELDPFNDDPADGGFWQRGLDEEETPVGVAIRDSTPVGVAIGDTTPDNDNSPAGVAVGEVVDHSPTGVAVGNDSCLTMRELKPKELYEWEFPKAEGDVARAKELASYVKHKVFDKIDVKDLPRGVKPLPCRWVYTRKPDGTLKARMTLRGDIEQRRRLAAGDPKLEVDSPTAARLATRLFLHTAVQRCWEVFGWDVSTAFLQQTPLKAGDRDDVYVRPPKEFDDLRTLWKMIKASYGLADAPRRWWMTIDKVFKRMGAKSLPGDASAYVWHDEKGQLIGQVVLHVDDGMSAGTGTRGSRRL